MEDDRTTTGTAIAAADEFALVPTNSRVQAVARTMRWWAETTIAQIEKNLPAPMEQALYLVLAPEFRLRPGSLKILLREFLGERELQRTDLARREAGPNLILSRFAEVRDFLQATLSLVDKASLDYVETGISMRDAARLVIAFGDHAEEVIDSLSANLGEIKRRFKMDNRSDARVMGFAIHWLATTVLDESRENGLPEPANILDYFEYHRNRFGELPRGIEED